MDWFLYDNDLPHERVKLLINLRSFINPFQPGFTVHIETSHLICIADKIVGFYMDARLVR